MLGTRIVETSRHLAIECPCNMLAQEAVLRAALQCSVVEDSEQARVKALGWRQLIEDQARLVVTGYRATDTAQAEGSQQKKGQGTNLFFRTTQFY